MDVLRFIGLAFLTAVCSGCAGTPTAEPPVTSVVLSHASADKVQAIFLIACSQLNGRIVSESPHMIECAKPMGNGFKENLYKAAATESYASNPDFHYQWTFFQTDAGVVANSSEWIEHQNAYGKTTRDDVQGGDASYVLVTVKRAWEASPAYTKSTETQ